MMVMVGVELVVPVAMVVQLLHRAAALLLLLLVAVVVLLRVVVLPRVVVALHQVHQQPLRQMVND